MDTQNQTRKIGELEVAVFGSEEQQIPGLVTEFKAFKLLLNGDGTVPGVVQKVGIMWRIHVWLLCAGSAGLGSGATILIQSALTHGK